MKITSSTKDWIEWKLPKLHWLKGFLNGEGGVLGKLLQTAEYTHCGDTRIRGRSSAIRILQQTAYGRVGGSFEKPPLVDRSHRTLAPKPVDAVNKPRPLIVKLHQSKELVLRLARQKGPLSLNGTKFHIFHDYSPDVNKRRAAFAQTKKQLHAAKIQFSLYYPAALQFT